MNSTDIAHATTVSRLAIRWPVPELLLGGGTYWGVLGLEVVLIVPASCAVSPRITCGQSRWHNSIHLFSVVPDAKHAMHLQLFSRTDPRWLHKKGSSCSRRRRALAGRLGLAHWYAL
jgi:hypothetical protein